MKNFFKVIGIIALVAVIGFSMTACDIDDDDEDNNNNNNNVNLSLNGVWLRGSLVITVSGNSGVFTSFNFTSGVWQDAVNKGYVKVGDTV